jgi:hypothetical protein
MQNDFTCVYAHVDLIKWLKLEIGDRKVNGSNPCGNSMATTCI